MLGDLSKKYESGDCGPGTISHTPGDLGGASYGVYQFASASGIPQAFVQWLCSQGYPNGPYLAQAGKPGTPSFDKAWKAVAYEDGEAFYAWQHEYAALMYFYPAKEGLRAIGYDLDKHHDVISQIAWSAAIHYSARWVPELFLEACQDMGYPNLSYINAHMFDKDFIPYIYQVRSKSRDSNDWISSRNTEEIKYGLRNRMVNECNDALAML
ncbi:hypothetical protein SPFL3102_03589 [Sporomusaceae bacterium FL31]|nr:hypothetical protein SPFL3101_00416 [Sporomusaceae bacterium FL31]GCE35738.1 hypothetical protein SPFL3102_03589 [Sporomusaceae bacterium]